MNSFTLCGDCLEQLQAFADNKFDSIVTDPPYGLSFMGKKWDYEVPSVEIWKECLRVLKPGGHLLSFSSARTYHRMVVNVEDAGFEIRDQIMWVYGSGFPKNHNLGEGKGTALKPAHEPIVLARKPISEKTIKENVLKWNTGGLNIDASRVPLNGEQRTTPIHSEDSKEDSTLFGLHPTIQHHREPTEQGRFPANFIHDGSQLVLDLFPQTKSTKSNLPKGTGGIWSDESNTPCGDTYTDEGSAARFFYSAKTSKKERNAAGENKHPTVKPIALMSYLINLITPPGGTVLDPFMGSGSTGCAAIKDNFTFVGIDLSEEFVSIANQRITHTYETQHLHK